MKIERVYTPKAVATTPLTPTSEAAAAMLRYDVGFLVADVMTPVVATVAIGADTHEAVELMRAHGAG